MKSQQAFKMIGHTAQDVPINPAILAGFNKTVWKRVLHVRSYNKDPLMTVKEHNYVDITVPLSCEFSLVLCSLPIGGA